MASDERLLTTQQDDLYRLLDHRNRFAPTDFRWGEEVVEDSWYQQHLVSVLIHKPTHFYFRFGPQSDQYSPGARSRTESQISEVWNDRLHVFIAWLGHLEREYNAPDLWQMMLEEKKVYQLASAPQLGNDPFTSQEKQYIAGQLNQIKAALASNHQLQIQQGQILEQGFAQIADGMDRLGKKDWLNYAMGSITSMAIAAAFAPDVTREMFHRFTAAVLPLFDAVLKLIS